MLPFISTLARHKRKEDLCNIIWLLSAEPTLRFARLNNIFKSLCKLSK